MATDELAAKLSRRNQINDALEDGEEGPPAPTSQVFNPYTEFKEFSRKQIQSFEKSFRKYDENRDGHLCLAELKVMMERLGAPQTHLGLKQMIAEVDEDRDGMISFREFLLIFRKASDGELEVDSGLYEIYMNVSEIDVDKEGVSGAKNFFAAKIEEQTRAKKFEEEILAEQEEKKQAAEDKKHRKAEFKNKATFFEQAPNN